MLGCGIMQQYKPDQEHIRMLEALATVSSLAFMAVIDFMLAYFGGDWLDRHLETGDHTMRGICIALAVISLIMTYYNLIQRSIYSRNDAGKKTAQRSRVQHMTHRTTLRRVPFWETADR